MVLSELPETTSLSRYCRQAMPRLCPLSVRTNSHVDVHQTLMVRSPDADTMYRVSKSTTLTAARCPTNTRRRVMSVGECMSQTAIDRSCVEHDPKQMPQSRELIFRCTTLKFAQCRNGRPDRQTGLNIPPLCHNLGCTMFTLLSIFLFSCNYWLLSATVQQILQKKPQFPKRMKILSLYICLQFAE